MLRGLGRVRRWQSILCAKETAGDRSWALLLARRTPPLAPSSPALAFRPQPVHLCDPAGRSGGVCASFGNIPQLHVFLYHSRTISYLHTNRRIERSKAVRPFLLASLLTRLNGLFWSLSSPSLRMSRPRFSHNTFSVQQRHFQSNEQRVEGEMA